ncbi:hypothetical protein EVA_14913, partial [gut metagenome]
MLVKLDRFQLTCYIKGSVCSAHGKQEIWYRVIDEFIHKFRDDELDFLWWICYRDFWEYYFYNGKCDWATKAYLQALAALNRNNRFIV